MNEQARAFLIYNAMLLSIGGSGGFAGGRMTAPEPPAEVRIVRLPSRMVRMLPPIVVPAEPALPEATAPPVPVEPAPVEPAPPIAEPPVIAPPVVEVPPLPPPRPKVEQPKPQPKAQPKPQPKARPKPEKDAPAKKPLAHKALPSCAVVQREYDAMSWPERISAYNKATPEEVAHGRRCLGR